MPAKLDINSFITKAKQVHGDIYDYSLSVYEGSTKHILIVCPFHGSFYKTPSKHLLGQGCPECSIDSKKDILKSKIKHYLNLDIKLFARNSLIKEIDNNVAYEFYTDNHLEGKGLVYSNSKSYGLFIDDKLLMCATVGQIYNQTTKIFKNKLHRICTLKGYTIVGGISKFNKYLNKIYSDYSYQILLSSGGTSLKYSNYRIIKPRYFWVNPNTLKYYHRNSTQKSKLEKTFKKPVKDLSETEYMESLGFLKVYDNGLAEIFIKEN